MTRLPRAIGLVVLALALAAAATLAQRPHRAWASHGGSHFSAAESVFPKPVDPWRHWGKAPHHKHRFTHPHGSFHSHPFKRRVIITPVPRAVWVNGYWAWNGFGWVWVPGHWVHW